MASRSPATYSKRMGTRRLFRKRREKKSFPSTSRIGGAPVSTDTIVPSTSRDISALRAVQRNVSQRSLEVPSSDPSSSRARRDRSVRTSDAVRFSGGRSTDDPLRISLSSARPAKPVRRSKPSAVSMRR